LANDAKRDQNHVPVLLGYDYVNDSTDMARVDPVTGYVLIEIQPRPDYVGVNPTEPLKRDQNHVTIMGAITDDANEDIVPVVAHPVGKLPMIDYI